jgi:hypothetical protein
MIDDYLHHESMDLYFKRTAPNTSTKGTQKDHQTQSSGAAATYPFIGELVVYLKQQKTSYTLSRYVQKRDKKAL